MPNDTLILQELKNGFWSLKQKSDNLSNFSENLFREFEEDKWNKLNEKEIIELSRMTYEELKSFREQFTTLVNVMMKIKM